MITIILIVVTINSIIVTVKHDNDSKLQKRIIVLSSRVHLLAGA